MRPNPCVKAIAVLAALTFGGLAPAIPPPTAAADDATTAATAATAAAAAATPTETAITVLGVTDLHGHIERTTDPATGAVADPGPPGLSQLATAAPHSETPFEALGSGGAAMTLIAVLQLVGRRARHVLAPLAAMGSMSLTVYCGHVLAAWALLTWTDALSSRSNLAWGAMSIGFVAFAMAWFAVWARGPLEHLVHVVSMRATRG